MGTRSFADVVKCSDVDGQTGHFCHSGSQATVPPVPFFNLENDNKHQFMNCYLIHLKSPCLSPDMSTLEFTWKISTRATTAMVFPALIGHGGQQLAGTSGGNDWKRSGGPAFDAGQDAAPACCMRLGAAGW